VLAPLLQPLWPTAQSIDGQTEVGEQRRVPDDHRAPVDGGHSASAASGLHAVDSRANLVWKDTVLVPTGQTIDVLFDVTHAGVWMAHCHIAEHHESGMMLTFRVDD
jgi:FtsP/CotA-like multicopper oxidase with cupredoxin domain